MQETLAEKMYQGLRRKVLAGEFPAGAQLVNRTLAQEMNTSLAPVREAIHRLATEGLVEHIPGAGAFVRKLSPQDLEELYILRQAVESCAAAEATRFIDDSQLEELDRLCQEFWQIAEQIGRQEKQAATEELLDQWLDSEEQFHAIIVESARNRLLKKVVHDYKAQIQIFEAQRHRATILTLAVAEETCRGHAAITAALRRRDADLVVQLMSAHIQRGRKTVVEYLRQQRRSEA